MRCGERQKKRRDLRGRGSFNHGWKKKEEEKEEGFSHLMFGYLR